MYAPDVDEKLQSPAVVKDGEKQALQEDIVALLYELAEVKKKLESSVQTIRDREEEIGRLQEEVLILEEQAADDYGKY